MDSTNTKIQSGNKSALPYFMVRITTKNDGNPVYLTAYKCQINKGYGFDYKKDDDDDRRMETPVEILASTDSTRNGFVWDIEGAFIG
jgi:hypothetical protein